MEEAHAPTCSASFIHLSRRWCIFARAIRPDDINAESRESRPRSGMHDPRHAACAGRRVLQSSLEESCKTMAPVQALARPRMVWCTEIEAKRYLKQLFVPGVVRILEELSPEAMYMDRLRVRMSYVCHIE